MTRLTIRIDFDSGASLGPGKIALLEEIERTGSIRRAAEATGMSFRQAWLLLRAMEEMFLEPVVVTSRGGPSGGGSALTDFGQSVVLSYRDLEKRAWEAGQASIARLQLQIAQKRMAGSQVAALSRRTLKSNKKRR